VKDEGEFIVEKMRENNYLKTTEILQVMNSDSLTELQAALIPLNKPDWWQKNVQFLL